MRDSTLRAVQAPEVDRVSGQVNQLQRIGMLRRKLSATATVGALFARATDLACQELGFARGVIVSVGDGQLRAETSDSLRDPASDRLRRVLLATPVALRPGTIEAELVRLMRAPHSGRPCASALAEALGLRHHGLAPIVVESRTLAILVVDRDAPALDALDTATLGTFAELTAASLEHLVLRQRQRELAAEMQSVTMSAQALMREMLEAPTALPSSDGQREAFPLTGPVSTDSHALRQRLSERETRIAALLVQGRSNREIAEELILSPETVKANVARILRKLGACNRVAAVTLILQLSSPQAA
jgi:DNA-binding CsgD family transcriptional regulator